MANDEAAAEALLDVLALRRWVWSICVVNFDVDYGAVIEYQLPPRSLTEEESTALCYMSFPDSHATVLGDMEYTFRPDDGGSGETAPFEDATHSARYLYGFTLFRQPDT
ncbi:hypothetical protein T492DRAFT_872561 [Pavlovales sp. CCMP2436]|nr:hypothetical protein T492DRAFT_872561 [Pavlovales sp. CCMP2436]